MGRTRTDRRRGVVDGGGIDGAGAGQQRIASPADTGAGGARAAAIALSPIRAVAAVARYMNAVLGGQDYTRYVAHLRRVHPDRAIPSESEYWRARHAAADRNPGTRCC